MARRRFGQRHPGPDNGPSLRLQVSVVAVVLLLALLYWLADELDVAREVGTQAPAFVAILVGTAVIGWFMRAEAERPPDRRD